MGNPQHINTSKINVSVTEGDCASVNLRCSSSARSLLKASQMGFCFPTRPSSVFFSWVSKIITVSSSFLIPEVSSQLKDFINFTAYTPIKRGKISFFFHIQLMDR